MLAKAFILPHRKQRSSIEYLISNSTSWISQLQLISFLLFLTTIIRGSLTQNSQITVCILRFLVLLQSCQKFCHTAAHDLSFYLRKMFWAYFSSLPPHVSWEGNKNLTSSPFSKLTSELRQLSFSLWNYRERWDKAFHSLVSLTQDSLVFKHRIFKINNSKV